MLRHRRTGAIWAALALAPCSQPPYSRQPPPPRRARATRARRRSSSAARRSSRPGRASWGRPWAACRPIAGRELLCHLRRPGQRALQAARPAIADGELDDDIMRSSVTTLKQPDRTPYPTGLDPEVHARAQPEGGHHLQRASRAGSSTPGSASTGWTAPMSATSRSRRVQPERGRHAESA